MTPSLAHVKAEAARRKGGSKLALQVECSPVAEINERVPSGSIDQQPTQQSNGEIKDKIISDLPARQASVENKGKITSTLSNQQLTQQPTVEAKKTGSSEIPDQLKQQSTVQAGIQKFGKLQDSPQPAPKNTSPRKIVLNLGSEKNNTGSPTQLSPKLVHTGPVIERKNSWSEITSVASPAEEKKQSPRTMPGVEVASPSSDQVTGARGPSKVLAQIQLLEKELKQTSEPNIGGWREKEGSRGGSREGSRRGSREGSRGGSREGSRGGSREGSRRGSRRGSGEGSRGGSREGSRDAGEEVKERAEVELKLENKGAGGEVVEEVKANAPPKGQEEVKPTEELQAIKKEGERQQQEIDQRGATQPQEVPSPQAQEPSPPSLQPQEVPSPKHLGGEEPPEKQTENPLEVPAEVSTKEQGEEPAQSPRSPGEEDREIQSRSPDPRKTEGIASPEQEGGPRLTPRIHLTDMETLQEDELGGLSPLMPTKERHEGEEGKKEGTEGGEGERDERRGRGKSKSRELEEEPAKKSGNR
jgi:hypothetical protein